MNTAPQTIQLTKKQRIVRELKEYLINAAYLAIFFSVIIFYRRMVLASYDIYLDDYFTGVVKALIIGKVIMLASFLSISRKFEKNALIVPVLYKAFIFTVWVIIFDIIEGFIRGYIQAKTLGGAWIELIENHFTRVWVGGLIIIFFTFIPFFALKELTRVMGEQKLLRIFFKKPEGPPDISTGS